MGSEKILVWNVRGLNSRSHCDAVHALVAAERPSLVCLQETKRDVLSDYDLNQIVGPGFDYSFLPAGRTRAVFLVELWFSAMYGPSTDRDKPAFLVELQELCLVRLGPWLLVGDFNMIYRAEDKNNNRLHRRTMVQFRQFLNEALFKELHCDGCLFTWSNERLHPTLECIDRAFATSELEVIFPNNDLQALSTLCSDHVSLLLWTDNALQAKKRFRFRSFWPKMPGFVETVQRAWHCPLAGCRSVPTPRLALPQYGALPQELE
jgi:exonuclease III